MLYLVLWFLACLFFHKYVIGFSFFLFGNLISLFHLDMPMSGIMAVSAQVMYVLVSTLIMIFVFRNNAALNDRVKSSIDIKDFLVFLASLYLWGYLFQHDYSLVEAVEVDEAIKVMNQNISFAGVVMKWFSSFYISFFSVLAVRVVLIRKN